MASTLTTNAQFQKPATADRNWDAALNANADSLDGMAAIGTLLVTPTEYPSTSLNIRVTAGKYIKADGTIGVYSGIGVYALPASATVYLWLTDTGQLSTGSSFPTTAHVRLAHAVTGATTVSAVVDERVSSATAGTGLGFVLKSGDTLSGTLSVASATTGVAALSVNPNAPSVGFFGVSPMPQAAPLAALVDNTTGVASTTLVDVGPTHSQSTLDANFATLAVKVNGLIAALKRHGLMSS